MEVLGLILPVFAVMITGYVFVRLGLLPEEVSGALIQFIFYVSIPALLFLLIAQEEIETLFNWPFIITFGGVTFVLFAGILLGSLYLQKSSLGPATMLATICVGANTAIIGLPLLHSIFGQKVAVLAAVANVIMVMVFLVQVLILEAAGQGAQAAKAPRQECTA